VVAYCPERDVGCGVDREAERSRADRGHADRLRPELFRDFERRAVRAGQEIELVLAAISPYRSDRRGARSPAVGCIRAGRSGRCPSDKRSRTAASCSRGEAPAGAVAPAEQPGSCAVAAARSPMGAWLCHQSVRLARSPPPIACAGEVVMRRSRRRRSQMAPGVNRMRDGRA
jgi:hypothetical protein